MLPRVIALFFALLLSVSAFAATGGAWSTDAPGRPSNTALFDAGAADASQDPVPADERPLDDQPGQSQSEGAIDPPALVMARPEAKAPLLAMSRPRPYAVAAWRSPYLDGPQRPPCTALVSA